MAFHTSRWVSYPVVGRTDDRASESGDRLATVQPMVVNAGQLVDGVAQDWEDGVERLGGAVWAIRAG